MSAEKQSKSANNSQQNSEPQEELLPYNHHVDEWLILIVVVGLLCYLMITNSNPFPRDQEIMINTQEEIYNE